MKKLGFVGVLVSALSVVVLAGNAHFVGAPQVTTSDSLATVSGKVAGLGNVPQIHVLVTGEAACINGGGHHPHAVNKTSASAEGDFPVQNGKAIFAVAMEAVFQPDCAPPMTVAWSNITVTVTAEDGTLLEFP